MSKSFSTFSLGPLPIETINKTLDLNLLAGDVRCSKKIHHKIATKHEDAYALFRQNYALCLRDPTYIGLHPKHTDKMELIRRVRGENGLLLLAIVLTKDKRGHYALASAYMVNEDSVTRWRRSGRLFTPAPV